MTPKDLIIRVLHISASEENHTLFKEALKAIKNTKYHIDRTKDYELAYSAIKKHQFDAYIIDFNVVNDLGLDLIKTVVKNKIQVPIIVFTEKANEELDVLLMKEGAADYIVKPEMTPALLERSIRYSYINNETLKQLSESEYRYRGLFEKSVDTIFIASKDYNIEEVNDSFLELMCCQKEDVRNINIASIFHKTEDYLFFVDSLLKESPLKGWEVVLLSTEGKKIECQMSALPLYDYNEEVVGYQCIIHDFTQRKKAERELLHAELLSVTGKMARSMAHEVRNPLTNLTLALEQLKSEINNEETEFLSDIIGRNAKRIDAIISEMLTNSTLDEIILDETAVDELLDTSLETVKDRILLKDIKLTKELDESISMLPVDKDKMNIALTNLLVNAIEAMEDKKGHLRINTRREDPFLVLEIADNGKGIEESAINKLFNPFYTKKHGGMGLGLTNTKNIINAHGGEINIESQLDQGTTFIISIPLGK